MTVVINVKVKGTEKVQAKMDLMFIRSKSFEPIFIKAKKQLELANAANFTAQGLPVGGWAPLDPQYAAWKAIRFPGRPIMVGNGKLFRSVTNMTSGISSIAPTKAEFGTNVEYAKFHQYGTRKMPKRKIIFEPAGFARSVGEDAGKWIVGDFA